MHDVLVIYKHLSLQVDDVGSFKHMKGMPVYTLSYDEKSGMQALNTTVDDKTPVPGKAYRDYEYCGEGQCCCLLPLTC